MNAHTYLFLIDYCNHEIKWITVWKLSDNVLKEMLISNFIETPIIIRDENNREFSALDGIKQIIVTASNRENNVSLEVIANVDEIIQMNTNGLLRKNTNNNDTHIIKNVLKSDTLNNSQKCIGNSDKKYIENTFDINCNDISSKILVGGIAENYDEFIINLKSEMYSEMYKPNIPSYNSVAIGININESYHFASIGSKY